MPMAPLLLEGITATAVPRRGLFIGGGPNVLSSGTVGSYGVRLDSVEVEEAASGGVSSMHFTIDDPGITVTVADGQDVRFWDIANNVPIFLGWIQAWSYVPDFGQQGRKIIVTCVGVEALLDWCVLAYDVTVTGNPNPTPTEQAIQSCVAAATATGPLYAFSDSIASSLAKPTGPIFTGAAVYISNHTIPAGTTLREAIRIIHDDAAYFLAGTGLSGAATVDMYGGLRTYMWNDFGRMPTDWTAMTVNDIPAGAIIAEDLSHETDAGGITRGVYVQGGNAAGSGYVSDGTGKFGPVATMSDTTILTADARNAAAAAYLAAFAVSQRGTFERVDHSPVFTVHAGAMVTLTDARAGQSANRYPIGSIRKTYNAVRENWSLSYGGLAPSAMRSVRRLTRATRS